MTAGARRQQSSACEPRLWFSPEERKLYLVPADRSFKQGGLLLRRGNGEEAWVRPDSVADFEVSEEQARAWSADRLRRIGARFRAGLRSALGRGGGTPGSSEGQHEHSGDGDLGSTPGLDLLADMSDRPRAQFDGDYRAVGEALRSYLADAVTTTLDGLSDQPQRKANARRRMREWGEILRAHGIAARDVDGPDDASSGTDEGSFRQGQGGSP